MGWNLYVVYRETDSGLWAWFIATHAARWMEWMEWREWREEEGGGGLYCGEVGA